MTRFLLEGEWTGYHSGQRKIVHREVIDQRRYDKLNIHTIVYTDGTSLLLSVRPLLPREKVQELHSYSYLIREAEAHGGSRVLVANLGDKK